jgi:hypothetical protein
MINHVSQEVTSGSQIKMFHILACTHSCGTPKHADLVPPQKGTDGGHLPHVGGAAEGHMHLWCFRTRLWCTCIMSVFVFILRLILINAMCVYRMLALHPRL